MDNKLKEIQKYFLGLILEIPCDDDGCHECSKKEICNNINKIIFSIDNLLIKK